MNLLMNKFNKSQKNFLVIIFQKHFQKMEQITCGLMKRQINIIQQE